MRGSEKNGKMERRAERKLEEAIEALVVSYTGAKDKEKAVMDCWAAVKGVVRATCDMTYATVLAAECSKSGSHKNYEARYYISDKGVNGNLVRSWEVAEPPEEAEEEKSSSPSRTPAYILFLGNAIMLRIGYHVSITGGMD